jgi:uncharacterized protein (TIGR03437 family)
VVKTDWKSPQTESWSITTLNDQNNAIIGSLMVPGTNFGALLPSVYRNIYVEDPPRVLFSLKILPFVCANCISRTIDLTRPGVLNLNLENIFTPPSILQNSIGFQTVNGAPLTGSMNIGLTNIMLTSANGTATPLTNANASTEGNLITNGSQINITYASLPKAPAPPQVQNGAVGSAASFAAPVAPGSLATAFGTNFGSSPAGVTVVAGGIVAPLIAVSPQQVTFQVPWQLFGQTQVPLTVTSGGLTSTPVTVPIANLAPGVFWLNAAAQAAVLVANTDSIAAPVGTYPGSRPVQRGEYISIFCTGLGPATHQPATGVPAGSDPTSTAAVPVSVAIGGVSAPVVFSGLAPGLLGMYQVNAQVPAGAPTGPAVSLTLSIGGKTANESTIAVAPAGP